MVLTEREFWLNYWEKKDNLIIEVDENFHLGEILKDITTKQKIATSLELGGFPGHYSIFLTRWCKVKASLLDYVIHPEIFKKLIAKNKIAEGEIKNIETDLFNYAPTEKYDLVFSNGLIEHFENTKEIIKIHVDFVEKDGVLFISLPNFKGFNGWLQKTFDPENYKIHNIDSMDIELLRTIAEDLKLKNIEVYYYGKFLMWLENIKSKSIIFKASFKLTWFFLKVFFKIIPIETKAFSPYIVLKATK